MQNQSSAERLAPRESPAVSIGESTLRIEDVVDVARGHRSAQLCRAASFVSRIDRGAAFLDRYLDNGGTVYGVTTGYGDSCTVNIPPSLVPELPRHLVRYHGCGSGALLNEAEVMAVLVARLNSLARGYSGVRWALLEQLERFIVHRILPCIPAEGSVGASGDLTPLSYVAAALVGEREVTCAGRQRPSAEVLREFGIAPLTLARKEGLAIMNGTAVMTGLACLAWDRAEYISRSEGHFHPRLFAVKPHAGQIEVADWVYRDMARTRERNAPRLQERYSIRCAPHVIGVLRDALTWMRRDIENELNSANDNPIVDEAEELVLHGGHFYGGHIAFAMDSLKTATASVADLLDRQMALLVDSKFNHGLPQNLSGVTGERAPINHGLKGMQISVSAWTAEALKLTVPATAFSRSTESHNQDKVSMGTIAARDCLRVLELTEQVAAGMLMTVYQALKLRERQGEIAVSDLSSTVRRFVEEFAVHFEFLEEDRRLDQDLTRLTEAIRRQEWALYA